MNRKQKIIVSITGIFIVLLALVGLTYAYFLTRITGNENDKSISVTTANLELVYAEEDDAYVIGEDEIIEPGKTFDTKTFTVTNNGNSAIDSYAVILEDVSITYVNDTDEVSAGQITTLGSTIEGKENDFTLVITCKNQDNEDCNGYNAELLEKSGVLLTNSIEVEETHTYTATLTYNETNDDQSADMNKRYNGKFNIIDASNTVDIEGTVTSHEEGDYVQTNSTKRVSVIYADNTYKIVGLETGIHEIKVCASNITNCTKDNAKMVETINIVQGETASGNNSTKTITITEDSRLASIAINTTNGITLNTEVKDYNPYEGILAINYTNGKNISLTTNKIVEDVDIKTQAYAYPFSITNVDSNHRNITIKLAEIEMEEALKDIDFRWGLYNADTNKGLSFGIFKDVENNEILIYRDTIIDAAEPDITKNYILRIWVHNNGTAQTNLLNKNFSAKIQIDGAVIEYTPGECFKNFNEETGVLYGSMPDGGYNYEICGTDIIVPKTINGATVTSIEGAVFGIAEGTGLTSLILPDTLTNISGTYTFYGASSNFTHLTIPENVPALVNYTLDDVRNLNSIILPENIAVGHAGFNRTKIETLVISNLVAETGFSGLGSYITDIVLMNGVKDIPPAFFSNNYITSIEIPSSVTSTYYSFIGCKNLQKIIVRGKTESEASTAFGQNWNCIEGIDYGTGEGTCTKYAEVVYR